MQSIMKLLAAVAICSVASQSALASGDAASAIKEANEAFESAFGKGDAKALASAYSENGYILAPGQPIIKGTPAIEAFWKGALGAGLSRCRRLSITRPEECHLK